MRTIIAALIAIILVLIVLISSQSYNQTTSANINATVRANNNCEIKKQVSLQDPKTGIDYTIAFCHNTCENGLPHTINETTMMIPESYSKERLLTTIEHEKKNIDEICRKAEEKGVETGWTLVFYQAISQFSLVILQASLMIILLINLKAKLKLQRM